MTDTPWRLSFRADPAAMALADRHYNRQNIGYPNFVPPATCLVLKTDINPATGQPWAVWVTTWPKPAYVRHAWAGAFVNSLFRRKAARIARLT